MTVVERTYIKSTGVGTAFAALSLLLTSCLGMSKDSKHTTTGTLNASANGIGGVAGFQQTVYAFGRTNCVECHGGTQVPLFATADVNASYTAALNYVNFTDIPYSSFVNMANNGHCGTPACSSNGNAMIQLINQWQQAYSSSGGGSGPPQGTTVLIGNVFTNPQTIPSPNPNCAADGFLPNPIGSGTAAGGGATTLACTYDGIDNQQNNPVTGVPPAACTNTCWTKLRYPVPQMSPQPSNSIARSWFEVDFAYDNYATTSGPASYVVANPRVVSLDSAVYVHDVRIFLNGAYEPNYGQEYQNADLIVTPWTPPSLTGNTVLHSTTVSSVSSTAGITVGSSISGNGIPSGTTVTAASGTTLTLSNQATATATGVTLTVCGNAGGNAAAAAAAIAAPASNWLTGTNAVTYAAAIEACNIPSVPNIYSTAITASGILQVNNPTTQTPDQIAFSFDYFQSGITSPCQKQSLWLTNVYTPIKLGALQCLNCHKSGGQVTEAGQRFNMDDSDPSNCPAGSPIDNGTAAGDVGGQCYVTGCTCTQAQAQVTVCEKFMQRTNLANPSQSAIIVQPSDGLNGMPQQAGFSDFAPAWEAWINSEAMAAGI